MPLRIRTKFIGILMIAALLPLLIALITFLWFGERSYRRSQGVLLQESAHHFSDTLSRSLRSEIEHLDQWRTFSDLPHFVAQTLAALPELNASPRRVDIEAIEAQWQQLAPTDPTLTRVLHNPLAKSLREFQRRNPEFAEIFITDAEGRLIAATAKTSDYWQADEAWWITAAAMQDGVGHVDGLIFDESAKVYSIDVSFPLHLEEDGEAHTIGVLKAIIDASPLFSEYFATLPDDSPTHEVILQNGQVLVSSQSRQLQPMKKALSQTVSRKICQENELWTLSKENQREERCLYGAAPISLNGKNDNGIQVFGMYPMWAVVYKSNIEVMAPVMNKLKVISLLGAILMLGFVGVGYFIASHMIIAPIRKLQMAAEAVSETVRLDETPTGRSNKKVGRELLSAVDAIQTRDEIEDLAREFSFMGQRILSYQDKLESEIHEKTRSIRKDLEFARDFQIKLMPHNYPEVESRSSSSSMGMNFHHVYKPASSVGGDFFDVLKLGDEKVGIFIADVMGHGVRSALITAILATLLHDNKKHADAPADFLEKLNANFYKMIHEEGEVIFASAFYLLLDLKSKRAQFATAGHPPPLLISRSNHRVERLTDPKAYNPVLGLFPECQYETYDRALNHGDLFLMFTDGVFECSNMEEEEFGQDRLRKLIEANSGLDLQGLSNLVIQKINDFTYPGQMDDDICLVGVELFENLRSELNELATKEEADAIHAQAY